MATIRITSALSRFATLGSAYGDHTNSADTLIVDDGAYLVTTATAPKSVGAILDPLGAWTLTVNGTIFSLTGDGVWLQGGAPSTSTITVGLTGEIGGGPDSGTGLRIENSATIKNAGLISGLTGIIFDGGTTHSVTNTGSIEGLPGNGTPRDAISDFTVNSTDILVNSGFMDGAIDFGSSAKSTTTNSGTITGSISLGVGDDTLTNNGLVGGSVTFGNGNNKYASTSILSKAGSLTFGTGNDAVTNAGTLGSVDLSDGKNSLAIGISGSSGAISAGIGDDTITNSGHINGAITLGEGNNKYTATATGVVASNITAGAGNDTVVVWQSGQIDLGDGKNAVSVLKGGSTFNINVGNGNSVITNSGTITQQFNNSQATVGFLDGNNVFTNSGAVSGDVAFGNGNNTVTNNGTIGLSIGFESGNNKYSATSSLSSVDGLFSNWKRHRFNCGIRGRCYPGRWKKFAYNYQDRIGGVTLARAAGRYGIERGHRERAHRFGRWSQ